MTDRDVSGHRITGPTESATRPVPEPWAPEPGPVARTVIGLVTGRRDLIDVALVRDHLQARGAHVVLIAEQIGELTDELTADAAWSLTRPDRLDGLLVAPAAPEEMVESLLELLRAAHRARVPMAAWGGGTAVLTAAGVPRDVVVVGDEPEATATRLLASCLSGPGPQSAT